MLQKSIHLSIRRLIKRKVYWLSLKKSKSAAGATLIKNKKNDF